MCAAATAPRSDAHTLSGRVCQLPDAVGEGPATTLAAASCQSVTCLALPHVLRACRHPVRVCGPPHDGEGVSREEGWGRQTTSTFIPATRLGCCASPLFPYAPPPRKLFDAPHWTCMHAGGARIACTCVHARVHAASACAAIKRSPLHTALGCGASAHLRHGQGRPVCLLHVKKVEHRGALLRTRSYSAHSHASTQNKQVGVDWQGSQALPGLCPRNWTHCAKVACPPCQPKACLRALLNAVTRSAPA